MKNKLILLLCLFLSFHSYAQSMSFQDFEKRFDQELNKTVAEKEKKLKALNVKYLAALLRLETTAKGNGDLDLVQATRNEITRVESGKPADTDPVPEELQTLRDVMDGACLDCEEKASKEIVTLVNSLKAYAENRSVEATKNSNIEEAVRWRDWESSLKKNNVVRDAYAFMARHAEGPQDTPKEDEVHQALKGKPVEIIREAAKTFSDKPRLYQSGKEPEGREKRIQNAGTPSSKGSGHTKLTATIHLIDQKEKQSKLTSLGYRYTQTHYTYVPRIKMSPLVGKSLGKTLVVFDLYKRSSGSKRSIIRTDKILVPPLQASDTIVVDAGSYAYTTTEYESDYFEDRNSSTASEFYGYIVTIFDEKGELIFQRTSERILDESAREAPPR